MLIKYKKIIRLGLIVIITLIVINEFLKYNEEVWASMSGSIGGISFDDNKFSNEEKDFLRKICLSRRNNGIDMKSEDAISLGDVTNDLILSISYKKAILSTKIYEYNLWIGNEFGYIQNSEKTKIYKLSTEENRFFINSYLKYHTKEDVESMISKKY